MIATDIFVPSIVCAHCKATIEGAVGRLDGVDSVTVDIERHSVAVAYEDARVALGSIAAAIEDAGYEVPGDTA